jgi:signal transduction histidine kinase
VFRNLLENAVKYSQPDSRAVELTLTLSPAASAMPRRAEAPRSTPAPAPSGGDTVIIRVTDDGPGIPEADIENLFEPFFRVDRSRSKKTGGYGLGLSICKRIIEAHGGTITAENNPVRGASFIVSLPRPARSDV